MTQLARQKSLAIGVAVLSFAILLSLPTTALGASYTDPIIVAPTEGSSHDGDRVSNDNASLPDKSDVAVDQGVLKDATGSVVEVTRGSKSLQFQSARNRQGTGIQYQSAIDSAEGGGTNGGFPMWEDNDADWEISKSSTCYVAKEGSMATSKGTKVRSLNCYVEWMSGDKEYVDLAHCDAGANNTKPAKEESYRLDVSKCPAPSWNTNNATNPWEKASATSWAPTKGCGTVTQTRTVNYKRDKQCINGTNSECETYHGYTMSTSKTDTESRNTSFNNYCPSLAWVSAGPTSGVKSNGSDYSTVTAKAVYPNGAPARNKRINFSTTRGWLNSSRAYTNRYGKASVRVKSHSSGNARIYAKYGVTQSVTVNFEDNCVRYITPSMHNPSSGGAGSWYLVCH